MKLRHFAGTALGLAGAVVVGNRLLRSRAGDLDNPLPGIERTYRWRGIDVKYTVAGDPDGPDALLLHGVNAAASSYEFEPIFERLSERYRVFAVDLPGFGRSDRPPLVYSSEIYVEFVRDFIADVTENPVVFASSLTASFAAEAVQEADGDVDRLVLICPTDETGRERPWLRTLVRTPVIGTALFNAFTSKPSLRYFMAREGYYDDENIDEVELEYAWRSAHQGGARYAPASFATGTLDPELDLESALADLEVPVTLVWGRDAQLVPLRDGRALADEADLDLVVIDYATLLPHAEHPEKFLEYIEAELPPVE